MFPARKDLKREARGIFKQDLLAHIGALLIIPVCGFIMSQLSYFVLYLLYDMVNTIVFSIIELLFSAFAVIMLIPLIYGYAVFLYEAVAENNTDIKNMFYAFSSMKLFERSYSFFLALFLRSVLYYIVPFLSLYGFIMYSSGKEIVPSLILCGFDATYTLLFLLTAVTFSVSAALFSKYFTAMYIAVSCEEYSVSYCFLRANVYNFNFKLSYFVTGIKFIPLILISIATFGLLFIVYTVPFMLTVYTVYAKYICDNGDSINILDINKYNSISH